MAILRSECLLLTHSGPLTWVSTCRELHLSRRCDSVRAVDTLFNKHYEDPSGFLRPGFGAFAGTRLTAGGKPSTGALPKCSVSERHTAVTIAAQPGDDLMAGLLDVLAEQLADPETAWSLGTFGAIAEFTRDVGEPVVLDRADRSISAVTARGALLITQHPELRLIASESPTIGSWAHRVALCLPEQTCTMNARAELTEVGTDEDALREQDRAGVLFDLGLGALQAEFYVRSSEIDVVTALRGWSGKSVFSPSSGAMKVIMAANLHRVFISHLGRIEVYPPIPPAGGKSPSGPHTHVLPKLLARGRTHSANEPLPPGWIPCAHFYPPHPARDPFGQRRPFQAEHHIAFQVLLACYGDPHLLALKQRVIDLVTSGDEPSALPIDNDRFGSATVRVALHQLQASRQPPAVLAAWLSRHDRFEPAEPDDPAEAPH
jgi:uncharacterized protein DUF6925